MTEAEIAFNGRIH